MVSSFELSWTKNNCSQRSENCHPTLIFALENVVVEENCTVGEKHPGKSEQSAVSCSTCWNFVFKKLTEPFYFSISLESVSSHNCETCLPCVRVGNFLIASVTSAMLSQL